MNVVMVKVDDEGEGEGEVLKIGKIRKMEECCSNGEKISIPCQALFGM